MIDVDEIYSSLCELTEISEDETPTALNLCKRAAEEIKWLLQPDADLDDERIILAASAKVFILCR